MKWFFLYDFPYFVLTYYEKILKILPFLESSFDVDLYNIITYRKEDMA